MSASLQKRGSRKGSAATKKIAVVEKIKKKRRYSSRARMRSNIRKAQLDTTPALKKKAYWTILRLARAYMTTYREDPKISRPAAELLMHDLDAHIHSVLREACVRANINTSLGDGMPTLSLKHIRAVMKNDTFRRAQQVCYIPKQQQ